MKPIFLPIFLCNSFKSPICSEKQGKYIYEYNGIQETNFMMAVQETNFLISFTLSAFSALCTSFTIMNGGEFDRVSIRTMIFSLIYGFYGIGVSIYLYGRKTDPQYLKSH
jgi:hypothetical protein